MSKKMSNRERELAAITHLKSYIEEFMRRWTRPRQRWDKLGDGVQELEQERLLLSAEVEDGAPSLRRLRRATDSGV